MTILLLVLATAFNLLAQFLLKMSVDTLSFSSFSASMLLTLVTRPFIWLGALAYGVSFVCYILALTRGDLGRLGPASQILTLIGVFIISIFVFHEHATSLRVIGVMIAAIGVGLILF